MIIAFSGIGKRRDVNNNGFIAFCLAIRLTRQLPTGRSTPNRDGVGCCVTTVVSPSGGRTGVRGFDRHRLSGGTGQF